MIKEALFSAFHSFRKLAQNWTGHILVNWLPMLKLCPGMLLPFSLEKSRSALILFRRSWTFLGKAEADLINVQPGLFWTEVD